MRSRWLIGMIIVFSVFLCGCNSDEDMLAKYDLGYEEGYAAGFEEGYAQGVTDGESVAALYSPGDYYINTKEDPLTIRENAAQNSVKKGAIPRGENIEILDTSGHWGYVTYEGISGWVNLDYCAKGNNPNLHGDYTSETVYVTDTGECYHKDGCGYLKSKISISLDDAKSRGYRPCSRCY